MMNGLMQLVHVLFRLEFFMIKKCAELSLTSFGTLNSDCVINTIGVFIFLPLIKNSVTIRLIL